MRSSWMPVLLLAMSGCVHAPRAKVDLSLTSASALGDASSESHPTVFGKYLQEVINAVEIRWERILESGRVFPRASTHVDVTFRLDAQGQVLEILKVEGDADTIGTNAALNAIRDAGPYRPWTKEMIAELGTAQTIHFSFYYQ